MRVIFFLSFFCYFKWLCAHNEIRFEQLDPEQQQIHANLYKQASIDRSDHTQDGRNFLSAAMRFTFIDGSTFILYIKNPITGKFFFVSGKEKPSFISKAKKLHKTFEYGFDTPKLSHHTLRQREQNVYSLTDSEMKFILTLTTAKHTILEDFLRHYPTTDIIQAIELHIFTTRDMCPCCFQHMQNFLDAINLKKDNSIFSMIRADADIPVTFFISSIVGFAPDVGSINFDHAIYGYCLPDKTSYISHDINDRKMHCIFLRKKLYTHITAESANTMQCIPQLNLLFQKKLLSIIPKPISSAEIYRRSYTKHPYGSWCETLTEKDLKKQKTKQRNRSRDEKRQGFFW